MLPASRSIGLALAVSAVRVAVLLPCDLGAVPNQETGVAGKFIFRLRDHLDDQFLGNEFSAGVIEPSSESASSSSLTTLRASGALADCNASKDLSWDSLTSERTSS